MWKHNDGCGESNILQNQFTAYLVTAVKRKKRRYQQRLHTRQCSEISLEEQEYRPELQTEPDGLEHLPLMEGLENPRLRRVLERQKERDRYIFLERALHGRSFVELAAELKLNYQTVTAAYYRVTARLKKGLRGEDL